MDIYEQADKMDADYYDFHTGYTYCIQKYNRLRKFFGIESQIEVRDSDGNLIGYTKRSNDN